MQRLLYRDMLFAGTHIHVLSFLTFHGPQALQKAYRGKAATSAETSRDRLGAACYHTTLIYHHCRGFWVGETYMSQPQKPRVKHIAKVIAVGSGKGGVGKSTTAVNLALAWQQKGLRVGLLDADIYGPNQPKMLGVHEQPAMQGIGGHLKPVEVKGLQTMSIGYLVEANTPMVLRGPMISKLMEQMLFQTDWPELDILVVDLPPGTGDIQLSLAKKIVVDGAIIVTTPQDVALLDARKAVEMFRKVDVPVLGVIENMSTHVCSACGHEEAIFGVAGGDALANACDLPLLGQLPLALAIRESSDQGTPIVLSSDQKAIRETYLTIAEKISSQLKKDTVKFPEIVVE